MKVIFIEDDPRVIFANNIDALYTTLVGGKTLTSDRKIARELGEAIFGMGEDHLTPFRSGHEAMIHAYRVVEHLWVRDGHHDDGPDGCHPAEIAHAWNGIGVWLA